jgi:predicted HTH domain antitoxin
MQVTVELPNDLAERADAAREALEAFAVAGYRSGALTPYQTRQLLGFQTRYQFDGFLKEREIWDHAYGVEDLESDVAELG